MLFRTIVDGKLVFDVVYTAQVHNRWLLREVVEPRKSNFHDQVILFSAEPRVHLFLDYERDILPRAVFALVADIRNENLSPGARPRGNVDVDDIGYLFLPGPGISEDTKMKKPPMKKFFQGHVQHVHPFLGRVAPGAGKDGAAGAKGLDRVVGAFGVSRETISLKRRLAWSEVIAI